MCIGFRPIWFLHFMKNDSTSFPSFTVKTAINFVFGGSVPLYMGKAGTIWQFFFALYFLALGGHCLQMLCLPGFRTHANTQNLPHFRAFPASAQERSAPKCLFFKPNAKLPNRPGFCPPTVFLSRGKVGTKSVYRLYRNILFLLSLFCASRSTTTGSTTTPKMLCLAVNEVHFRY